VGYHSLMTTTHPSNVNLPFSGQQGTARLYARKTCRRGGGDRTQNPLVRDATLNYRVSHNRIAVVTNVSVPFIYWWPVSFKCAFWSPLSKGF